MAETRTIEMSQEGNYNVQFGEVSGGTFNFTYNVTQTDRAKTALGASILTRAPFSREYYNLFVIGGEKFDSGSFTVSRRYSLTEFIEPEVKRQFFNIQDSCVVERILSFPSLFMSENPDYMRSRPTQKAVLGRVTDLELLTSDIRISFETMILIFQQSVTDVSRDLAMNSSPGNSYERYVSGLINVLSAKRRNDEIAALTGQITADNTAAQTLDRKNDELNRQIVSIRTAVDGINKLLRDSGFQGFELRVHEGSGQSAYRVIRPHTGKVAKDLSEGERNFIAFLYFYYLVRGSHSDNDIGKDKVVVIDDPVSSMDATVLHIVSMLVRDIADTCLSQESIKGVKQVFVLTHNVHFHTKTANYLVSRYDVASYYLLRKSGNISTIQHCVQDDPRNIGGQENFNPVPSEYAALWKEFKTVESPKSLFSLIWQILDFYFVIITEGEGGGDGLRYKVLVENRDNFIERLPNGTEDNSKLVMATKLLSYMGSHTNYESQYSEPGEDISQYRDAFKMIFTAMGQDQHYQMMMTETEKQ